MTRAFGLLGAALGFGAMLSGCTGLQPGLDQSVRPIERPAAAIAAQPEPAIYVPSQASRDLRMFYARLEQDQRVRGLMRTDGGGIDAPYTDRMLAENFMRIALFDEHGSGNISNSNAIPTPLRRWEDPVRLRLIFGNSVDQNARQSQQARAASYTARLARASGHPMRYSEAGANFHVLVLDEDERRASAPILRSLVPRIDSGTVRQIQSMPRDVQCLVVTFAERTPNVSNTAIAVLRSEHPPASWLSCLHEEVAQGMGLSNDSQFARPSIFNDDNEYGLLTTHDEQLLKILYDPRLRPGMTAEQARPIVNQIAAEILGQPPLPGFGPA